MSRSDLKILSLISVLFLIFLIAVPAAFAHSPTGMELEYDKDEGTLEVDITHSVNDPDDHYVERVEIRRNGELVNSEDYTSQPSNSTFSYTFTVSAEEGDSLQVEAFCNQFGSITEEMEVDGGGEPGGEGDGNLLLILGTVIAAIIIVAVVVYYKMR